MIGDPTGSMSKVLKMVVVNQDERTSTALGLDLLTTMDSIEITRLAQDPSKIKTDAEKAMVDIINDLGIKEDKLDAFTENLKKGSIAVVQNDEVIQSPVLIESRLEEGVLFDAEIDSVSNDLLEEASKLIAVNQRIAAPLGEIEFSLDTNGQELGLLDVQIPKESIPNALVKTTIDGTPYMFKSEIIT